MVVDQKDLEYSDYVTKLKIRFFVVEKRDRETLIPIVEKEILPDSIL